MKQYKALFYLGNNISFNFITETNNIKQRHDDICFLLASDYRDVIYGDNVFYYNTTKNLFLDLFISIISIIKIVKLYDVSNVINLVNPIKAGFIVYLSGIFSKADAVLRVSSDVLSRKKSIVNSIKKFFFVFLLKRVNKVIVFGNKHRKIYGLYNQNIYVIPPYIDLDKFGHVSSMKEKNAYTLLFIGRLTYLKGFDRFIKLMTYLSETERKHKYKFIIIGKGKLGKKLRKLKNKKLDIEYHEELSHNELHKIYNNSDITIITSRLEGLPNVVLESLASQVPVVSTNVGVISDYVSNIYDDIYTMASAIDNNEVKLDVLDGTYNEYIYSQYLKLL